MQLSVGLTDLKHKTDTESGSSTNSRIDDFRNWPIREKLRAMQNMSKAKRRSADGEIHRSQRASWLRAAVLGADDAIVSTASLMIGVAAADADKHAILISGVAGLFAGALSMAAGEFVSVSSQRDAEQADIELERFELDEQPRAELDELTLIYV